MANREGDIFKGDQGRKLLNYLNDTYQLQGPTTGEANTASNVGTSGVGIFEEKTGVDLEFKKLNNSSGAVTITDDTGNSRIDLGVDESQIDHDALSNFSADEHINWRNTTENLSTTGTVTGNEFLGDVSIGRIQTGTPNPTSRRGLVFQTSDGDGLTFDATNIAYDSSNLALLFGTDSALVNIFTANFNSRMKILTNSFFLAGQSFIHQENTVTGPTILLLKSRGSTTPADINSGDDLGKIIWGGYYNSTFNTSAQIQCIHDSTGDLDALNVSGKLIFSVTGAGAGLQQPATAMTIFHDKDIEMEDDLLVKGNLDCDLDITATGDITGANLSGTNTGDKADSAIDHDALSNYVANEHIDWTNATDNFDTSGTADVGGTLTTGAGRIESYSLITSGTASTASASDHNVIVDVAVNYNLTLPAAPSDGTIMHIATGPSFGGGVVLTITRGGSDTFAGGGTTATINRNNTIKKLIYNAANTRWYAPGS